MKRGAVCLLLLTLEPVQAIVSRRQASNSSRPSLDSCSCSCCVATERTTGLTCAPQGEGCGLCAPGSVLQASFAALHNEVDYSRYCFAACQPLNSKEDAPCEARNDEFHPDTPTPGVQLLAAAPAASPAGAPESAAELQHTGEVAAESLAEVALMRAQRHAREAKQSAALARFAYERLAKSREEAAEAAGQAALEDVIIDARKDAGEAVKIRAGWEDAARAHAAQKAVVAAAVYKKAKLRDLQVAEAWEKQSTLLLKTSRQYEEYAARQEMKEKKLKEALKKVEDAGSVGEAGAMLLQGNALAAFAPAPAPASVIEAPVLSGPHLGPLPEVAQAPVAAWAPPPATASAKVAQAPVAATAFAPASAMDSFGSEERPANPLTGAVAAAPAPASAVEMEGGKKEKEGHEKNKKEGNEEKSKEEGKEEKSKEEKSKEEGKEEKSKEEKSKEEGKEEKSKEEGKEEKSKEEGKEEKSKEEKSKEEGKEEGKEEKSKEEGKEEKSKEEKSKEEGKEEKSKEEKGKEEKSKEEGKEEKSKEEKGKEEKSKEDGKVDSKEKSKKKGEEDKSKDEGKEEGKAGGKEKSKEESKEEDKDGKKKSEEKSTEEGKEEGKEKSENESKEEDKEGKKKSEEKRNEENKEEKSKKEGKEEGKEDSKEKSKQEEKGGEEGKDKAKAPPSSSAASPAAAAANSAIFGGGPPLAPAISGPKDEKSRLLEELQTTQAQVDAGLKFAHEYELQAHAARKEAEGIRANASWYDGAEAAAAAHTLYAELPKGVIPPPLPALP